VIVGLNFNPSKAVWFYSCNLIQCQWKVQTSPGLRGLSIAMYIAGTCIVHEAYSEYVLYALKDVLFPGGLGTCPYKKILKISAMRLVILTNHCYCVDHML